MPTDFPTVIESRAVVGAARAAWAAHPSTAVLARVLGFCLLGTLAAQVRVPVPGTEVPMTLQLLAVLVTGLSLSPKEAAGSWSVYLILGTAGLPVFSPGSMGLFGPTGGYLAGFVPAAWLVSALRGRRCGAVWRFIVGGVAGVAVVFVFGVGWRMAWFGGDGWVALQTGMLPFAVKAVVELALAVAAAVSVDRWRQRYEPTVRKSRTNNGAGAGL